MYPAVLPFSMSDVGWLCLAAAVLLSTMVVLRLVVVASRDRPRRSETAQAPVAAAPSDHDRVVSGL